MNVSNPRTAMGTVNLIGEFLVKPMLDVTLHEFRHKKKEIMFGGKVILPESALQRMSAIHNLPSPIIVRINSPFGQASVTCGCISFDGNRGEVVVPVWMFKQLMVNDSDFVIVNALTSTMAVGQSVTVQPQDSSFFDISNSRPVLEYSLRNFDCLTEGDMLQIYYIDQIYDVLVVSTQPARQILIVNCDLNVEFREPKEVKHTAVIVPKKAIEPTYKGQRLDGKALSSMQKEMESTAENNKTPIARGMPDFNHKVEKIDFIREKTKEPVCVEDSQDDSDGKGTKRQIDGHITGTNFLSDQARPEKRRRGRGGRSSDTLS